MIKEDRNLLEICHNHQPVARLTVATSCGSWCLDLNKMVIGPLVEVFSSFTSVSITLPLHLSLSVNVCFSYREEFLRLSWLLVVAAWENDMSSCFGYAMFNCFDRLTTEWILPPCIFSFVQSKDLKSSYWLRRVKLVALTLI